MSEIENRYVYRGVWVKQMDGSSKERTITVDAKTSTIIVALLAVMSTIGAAHLWSLLLFVFLQQRASGRPENALFRQQQALIRASPTPGSFVTEMIKLWWTWRRKGRVLSQCLLPAFFSLVFSASTLTASVFSSVIVSSLDIEVLVDSPYCGFRNATRAFWKKLIPSRGIIYLHTRTLGSPTYWIAIPMTISLEADATISLSSQTFPLLLKKSNVRSPRICVPRNTPRL